MFPQLHTKQWNMRKKLFAYMLYIASFLIVTMFSGLLVLGEFDTPAKKYAERLSFQQSVFRKDIEQHFDALAASSIDLSRYLAHYIDKDLSTAGISFSALLDNPEKIEQIQNDLIPLLSQRLQRQHASGSFVILNSTVNSAAPNAAVSRTGLYLYHNRFRSNGKTTLLRGNAAVGKAHNIRPHYKWRMEFRTDLFPNYDQVCALADLPLTDAYLLTDTAVIDGTSDRVMLMTVPITSEDGTFYGICGYEISTDYYRMQHTQPATLPHLSFLLTPQQEGMIDPTAGLSCGANYDYYLPPTEPLAVNRDEFGHLLQLTGASGSYVGVAETVTLTPNNPPYTLTVMLPKEDYDHSMMRYMLQITILMVLLLFFSVSCSVFFSRRYLRPILHGLEQLRSRKRTEKHSPVVEINDLFVFLDELDRQHQEDMDDLQEQFQQAQAVYRQAQLDYGRTQADLDKARTEVERLAYARKSEIDPDDYQSFLSGVRELTKTERTVFKWYLSGKTAVEIQEIMGIKESTLKFHNHNILNKLGVSSRKQMLRYAALMERESTGNLPQKTP